MRTRFFFAALAITLSPAAAWADADLPKGTVKGDSVSKGKTDVTAEGFQSAGRREEETKDATELAIQGGGLATTGNSKQLAVTSSFNFRLRRDDHQFTAIGAWNYSRAAVGGKATETTVDNLQGKARYDRFFATDWTVFLGTQARRDRFAGLDLRLQIDPGVGYYFVNEASRVFWAELGYDLLHDVRRDAARVPTDADGNPIPGAPLIDKTSTVHSGRGFIGYRNKINDGVSLTFGVEFLQGLSSGATRRVNGEAVVTSKFTEDLALATSFLFRYDNQPLPGKEQLDTITSVSLVLNVL